MCLVVGDWVRWCGFVCVCVIFFFFVSDCVLLGVMVSDGVGDFFMVCVIVCDCV